MKKIYTQWVACSELLAASFEKMKTTYLTILLTLITLRSFGQECKFDFDKLTFVVLNLIKLEVETMFLNLEKLRKEFKEYRKIDDDISSKIDILITVTKFEMAYSGPDQAETKKKKFSDYLKGIQLSLRTLQRFKKNYIERDK